MRWVSNRIGQVANISNGTRPHVDHKNVSLIHQSAISVLCMIKWRNLPVYLLLDLKLLWGSRARSIKNFAGHRMRERDICLPFSGVWTYHGKVAKYTRKRNLSQEFDQHGCGWSPLCYWMGQFKQQQDHSAFHPFRVWYFRDSRILIMPF